MSKHSAPLEFAGPAARSGLIQSGRAPSRENASGLMLVSPSAVGPAQQGATQPARHVAVDDEAEAPSKMKELSLSVVLLAHSANAPAPKVHKMHKITIYKRPTKLCTNSLPILVVLDSAPRREHPCPPPHSKMPIPPHLRVPTMTTKKHRKKQKHYQRAYQCLWLFKPLFALFLSTPLASPDLTHAADAFAA